MTLDELLAREAIRQTMARYTTAGDRLNVEIFKTVFAEDAILESEGVEAQDQFRFQGREQIGAWLSRWSEPGATSATAHQATFVRHHLATCDIELLDADNARARTYWTAYTDIGPDHGGYYLDSFRKVADVWLIAHRRIRLDWRADGSLFTEAVAKTR